MESLECVRNHRALAKRKLPREDLDTATREWDKIIERRGPGKQKALWDEKLAGMKAIDIEHYPEWAVKAR